MATRRPSLPSASEIGTYSGPQHPVVSAVQFSEATRNTGGATMNVHTNKIEPVGEKGTGYSVGQAPDMRTGGRVKTEYEPMRSARHTVNLRKGPAEVGQGNDLGLKKILNHRDRIRATGRQDPNRAMGSWDARSDGRSTHDIDASQVFHDKGQALAAGAERGESAIFDLHAGTDIAMPKHMVAPKRL